MAIYKYRWVNQRFGRWLIKEVLSNNKAIATCDCGTEKIVNRYTLKKGLSKSCGCYKSEWTSENKTTHGKTKGGHTKVYTTWQRIISRCTNPNNNRYQDYALRGIYVAPNWLNFEEFYKDMGEPPSKKHSIERVDNNGPYSRENCVWATPKTQARNRRTTYYITLDGRNKSLAEWVEEFGMPYKIVWDRIRRYKWSVERALTTPVNK